MTVHQEVFFMRPECVVCRKSLGKGRVWKEREGSLCRRCNRDLQKLAAGQSTSRNGPPFRFSLFDRPKDLVRAEEIWNKPAPDLSGSEREWADGVMKIILCESSLRGRKAAAEHERIERLLVRLALTGKPRPSYGQIAELLLPQNIEKPYRRDRILQALKRRRKAVQLPPPPLPD